MAKGAFVKRRPWTDPFQRRASDAARLRIAIGGDIHVLDCVTLTNDLDGTVYA
jgi:hypothetical protein